ncbi:MAG: orotidine-5'-phosphate decarboxylase [Methylococcaceae bacterium]|nr:orotidine-5'-phosphate decarboxylase [Methylococcaceae bacterium]MCI0666457.1 orotidine-5'-phosphate decarboxylase [Methylococcaceae bacterium]MCI0732470.1 orotidine-5'-phosphate decarboxylase [Methylococcaceae bacterium]
MKIKNIPIDERIIFALDVDSLKEAEQWVKRLESHIRFYKVGLQLFMAGWYPVIEMILNRGHKVMVDLKFFDIPETVRLAVQELKNRNATFITVHGNEPILKAACEEKSAAKILAVTLLTSFDESDMRDMGLGCSIGEFVLHRARKALTIGCDGIISSGLEAKQIRQEFGDNFLVVTPGIRPGANILDQEDDQRRIASAEQAILNGADHVVVGRPIRNASDPLAVVESMQKAILAGLNKAI